MKKWSLFALLLMSFSGCETLFHSGNLKGNYIEKRNVNNSLEGIIRAFDRVTTGVRGKSTNGREIVSRYQAPKGSNEVGSKSKTRGYARLLILGDRRPYDLQMQFVVEEDQGEGDYLAVETDDDKAQKILKKLIDTLAARPDNKDFIDDFKAF